MQGTLEVLSKQSAFYVCFAHCFTRMSSVDKLSNSFHAAGTNGRLDLSLPKCASCFPTNCPCSTWLASWIAQFAKESVAPNRPSPDGWVPARTGKSFVGVGCKHPVTMCKASLINAVNEASMRTTTPNWCAVLSCGVDREKAEMRNVLASALYPNLASRLHNASRVESFLRKASRV